MNFFAELKRRHIYRIGAAYAVVAWVLLQLVNNVAPVLDLPQWVARAILLLLVVGFPVALLLAWVVEAGPQGIARKGGRHASPPASQANVDWIVAGALAVVIALILYQQIAPPSGARTAQVQQAGVAAARTAAASPKGALSIAVLPFLNLSSDKEQEFFADGMTEEITSALAKVPDLRVVARTSAFEFKGKNVNIKTMGDELGATHLIEGSVRKEDNRVRITVQLIKADDGTHVWAEDYDRQLTDIFAIQEDIARAITASLRMPLGLRPGENLVNNRNIDQESYQQYLRAKQLVRGRLGGGGLKALNEAIGVLENVVKRNPDYAPAWAVLSSAYRNIPNYSPDLLGSPTSSVEKIRQVVQSAVSKAEPAAQKAIKFDPNLAEGYAALGVLRGSAGHVLEREELLLKARSLDPNDPETLNAYSDFLAEVGRVKEALSVSQQLQQLEPFIPLFNRNLALVLWLNGQDEQTLDILRKVNSSGALIALVQAAAGRYGEAADTLMASPAATDYPAETAEAIRLLRKAPTKVASPQSIKYLGNLNFVYLYVGAPEEALEMYKINLDAGWTSAANRLLPHPSYGPARKTEQYKAFARKAGLVEYWRAKGWPDFCHPTPTGDDFACE